MKLKSREIASLTRAHESWRRSDFRISFPIRENLKFWFKQVDDVTELLREHLSFWSKGRSPPFLTIPNAFIQVKKKHNLPVSNIKESTGVHCDISRFTEMLKITTWLKLDSHCEWRLFSTRRELKNLQHNKKESSCCYVFIPKVYSRLLDQYCRVGLNKTRLGLNRFATKVLKWIHKFELHSITLVS